MLGISSLSCDVSNPTAKNGLLMYRTIWSYYFITGLLSLTAGVPVMDDWATALVPDADGAVCRLAAAAGLSRTEITLCLASGFNAVRSLAGGGFDALFQIRLDMPVAAWIHVADILVIMLGTLAAAIALIWVWANGMTRLAGLSLTGTYTLVRAIGMALDRRGYRA